MNELDYASREASRRLWKAGIVLETEAVWVKFGVVWELIKRPLMAYENQVPAPMFTEVWRELPERLAIGRKKRALHFEKWKGESYASYENYGLCKNTNPTDALIDLRIWIEEQGKEKG